MVADGLTTAEIKSCGSAGLEPEDVAEALRYATEAVRERQLPVRQTA
jgi:hypothetical protein